MLRHQENIYKLIHITYHGKYTPYPMLSYGPYDCPLCPVKGLYHEMRSIVIACRGDSVVRAYYTKRLKTKKNTNSASKILLATGEDRSVALRRSPADI